MDKDLIHSAEEQNRETQLLEDMKKMAIFMREIGGKERFTEVLKFLKKVQVKPLTTKKKEKNATTNPKILEQR